MLIEGPFESDYSLAIVNRRLALAMVRAGRVVHCHQRDNTTDYRPSAAFLASHPELAPCFVGRVYDSGEQIHSRYIYPPFTDRMIGDVKAVHCYGWEESVFPQDYVQAFNRDLDVITVMSAYVRDVLIDNGVTIPVEVVGLGVDHILESPPERIAGLQHGTFHFLHISSCFPRKGADVLVQSFCREFQRGDNVCLIIKTFANPHNEIEQIIAEATSQYPGHAPIKLLFDPFSVGQMRYLMEQSDCLVAPSRGEGFGLPVAESMLLGRPVIATMHGGHADLCSPEWCWPVDFRIAPARTHLTEGASRWAEPHPDSLAARMREVYEATQDTVDAKIRKARAHIERFTWAAVATRHHAACASILADRQPYSRTSGERRIGFLTTWNARCGIAEYTRYLATSLSPEYPFSIFANRVADPVRPDEPNVQRCWTDTMEDLPETELEDIVKRIAASECDAVSIQHNFGLFSPATTGELIRRLKHKNIAVIVTLHATINPRYEQLAAELAPADAVIVHHPSDRDRLADSGISRVQLLPQGIYAPGDLRRLNPPGDNAMCFMLSCFGFFLPPKGIYQLLQAFAAAVRVNGALRLKLVNSLYNEVHSAAYAAECMQFIRRHNLSDRVLISTEFLDQEAIIAELAESDLVVLPYTQSSESSSAAIRLPLSSQTPILCSDLHLFQEFADLVHFYPAQDSVALANRLLELSSDSNLLRRFEQKQREYVDALSWRKVTAQFQKVIASCVPALSRHATAQTEPND
jgi:glycosyltransferase involved in cell wall biosynthesis